MRSMLITFALFYHLQKVFFASSQEIRLHVCNNVIKPALTLDFQENCTLLCGLYIYHYVLPHGAQEVLLCTEDEFSPLLCQKNDDCHRYHPGSYCKKIQCLCEGSDSRFIPKQSSNFIETCAASSNWLHSSTPLVAFPWKTVLAVFGTLGLVVIIFIGFRWFYPICRIFRSSNDAHRSNNEHCASSDDNAAFPLYPNNPQIRLSDRSVPYGNTDKPPSYETLTKLLELPPSYEESTVIPHNRPSEENQNQRGTNALAPLQPAETVM